MKDKQRAELLDIIKVLLEEDLSWFELRTPTTYIRIGAGPDVLSQPGPAPTGNGQATAAVQAVAVPPALAPAVTPAPAVAAPPVKAAVSEVPTRREQPLPPAAGGHIVTAPFAGVFYRRPSPAEPPFVEVGSQVRAAETVCLVEVMKLFNSVQAGVDGVVTSIEVGDGQLVEYGQMLMRVAPAGQP